MIWVLFGELSNGLVFVLWNLIVGVCFWWRQISEYQIIEITENVCNLKKAEADWILLIDIVEQGDKLQVWICGSLLLILCNESIEIV